MAVEYGGRDITLIASEDMSTHQYRFVNQKDDDEAELMNAATDKVLGIMQNAPISGEVAVIRIDGTSKLVANDAIAVEAFVKAEYVSTSDNGKADAADTAADYTRAQVIQASGAEDDLCGVRLVDMSYPIT